MRSPFQPSATAFAPLGLAALALAGCGPKPQVDSDASLRSFAPAASVAAQLPLHANAGEPYQDHLGPAFPVGSAPSVHDTGGERIPSFPASEPPMAQPGGQVLMPNGGGRIVQSVNSLP